MIAIQKIIKNQTLIFMVSRYASFGLRFLGGILIAKFLGPYLFGVWGFLTLARQYFSYTSFGLQYAVTVELSTNQINNLQKQEEIIGAAFSMAISVAVFLILLGGIVQYSNIELFEKYSFNQYILFVSAFTGFNHLNQILLSIYRVHRKLLKVAISEISAATALFMVTLFFKGDDLIFALLSTMVLAEMFSLVLYLFRAPFRLVLFFDLVLVKQLLAIGLPLLIYNASFYLITLSSRTILSVFYSVEIMGYYSLATSLASATLLGINAVAWVVFPSVLAKTHGGVANETARKAVEKVSILYGTSVFAIVLVMIMLLPILFLFLPQYKAAEGIVSTLLLSQAVLAASFGYNSIAIARKKQLRVAKISLIAVAFVTTSSLLVSFLDINFMWIAVSVLGGSFLYTILQAYLGSEVLGIKKGYFKNLWTIIPLGNIIAILCILVGNLLDSLFLGGLVGLLVFSLASRKELGQVYFFGLQKIRDIVFTS